MSDTLCVSCRVRPQTPIGDLCRRCRHYRRGPTPSDTAHLSVYMAGPTYRLLCQVIPKGERSAWVAKLVRRELEGEK